MIGERDIDRILGAWAREGVDTLPDRLVDAVLADVRRLPQRRRQWVPVTLTGDRTWLRLVLVAAALLALAAVAVALISGNVTQPRGKAFRGDEALLEPGRYVIDAPFEFHLSIDVPRGWRGVEEASGWTALAYDAPEPRPQLVFATVAALPVDPCRPELGVSGPQSVTSVDRLLDGLSAVVDPSFFGASALGGRPARLLTVTGGPGGLACSNGSAYRLWTLGEPYDLVDQARDRIWFLDVDGRTLVVAARDFGATTRAAEDLDAMLGSMLFGADAPLRPSAAPGDIPTNTEPPIPSIPPSGLVQARDHGYLAHFDVWAYGTGTSARLVQGQHDWVMPVLGDWNRTSHGMVREEPAGGAASLSIWSIRRVYVDPCHWQSSLVLTGLAEYVTVADSLTSYWYPNPVQGLADPGYTPPAFSPSASTPVLQGYPGLWSMHLNLVVPDGFDVTRCDGGEYRIWEDHDGTARTAQPGEFINVRVSLLKTGVVVLEGGFLPGTSDKLQADLRKMLDDSSLLTP